MAGLIYLTVLALHIATAARVLTRPNREPAARMAWLAVIFAFPLLGMFAYLLLGETNIGRNRAERKKLATDALAETARIPGAGKAADAVDIPIEYKPLFTLGQSVNGFAPVAGNSAELMADSDATIDAMVADIDAATDHIHLIFYIWLADTNGTKIADALVRAAQRGVTCRAMIDDLGSRAFLESEQWAQMGAAGVKLGRALPIGNPLMRILSGRVDLRNHRKILVIDNKVTYCGSQNCADPAFSPKPKYAPWVDAMMRFEGPIVRQNQLVFASDWMTYVDEDIRDVIGAPIALPDGGFPAQVIATGPTTYHGAMPDLFASLMQSSLTELIVTTPYYAPNEAMQSALRSAGRRGVATTLILPARNDNFAVAAASRAYYLDLLKAGVRIYEYPLGLLHTKSVTVDGQVTLIGSANLDRRSFDLNYENNILFYDRKATEAVRERQQSYVDDSIAVMLEEVEDWPFFNRLWNNTWAVASPLL